MSTSSDASAQLDQTLEEAISLHQRGRLSEAASLYERILSWKPQHRDALHLSGVIARQTGDYHGAVQRIEASLVEDGAQPIALCNLGTAYQALGESQRACVCYDQALVLRPGYVTALSNRGNAMRSLGRLEDALANYDEALAIDPINMLTWRHRGDVMQLRGMHVDALESYERALAIAPQDPKNIYGRASALHRLGRDAQAFTNYASVLKLDPAHVEALCAQGILLHRRGDDDQALWCYDQALSLNPNFARAHLYRANLLRQSGHDEAATDAYLKAREFGVDVDIIDYALASLGVKFPPAHAPVNYVRDLFDEYSGSFDTHLVTMLDYRVPGLLADMANRFAPAGPWDTLDAGCGTGLCGALLRKSSSSLTGIDLSSRMLEHARKRGVYDSLICGDLCTVLDHQSRRFDLVVAADVLVYFGDLGPVFRAFDRCLRPGGTIVLTLELGPGGYTLGRTNRYSHSQDYVEKIAGMLDWTILGIEQTVIRTDGQKPVMGLLVAMRP